MYRKVLITNLKKKCIVIGKENCTLISQFHLNNSLCVRYKENPQMNSRKIMSSELAVSCFCLKNHPAQLNMLVYKKKV